MAANRLANGAPLLAVFLFSFPFIPRVHASTFGTTIIDPAVSYSNGTGGGGLGSFNSSGLDPGFDDDEVLFRFAVSQTSTLTAFTTSFASGGFAPDITLFADDGSPGDPTGTYIAQGTEGSGGASCGPTQGTVTLGGLGYCLDSFLQTLLNPGSYLLVLTEDPNLAGGDGFAFNYGNAFFLYPPFAPNSSPPPGYLPSQNNFNGGFVLDSNFPRTPGFDVEADLASEAAAPEPGTILLLFSGLIAGAIAHRKINDNRILEERP